MSLQPSEIVLDVLVIDDEPKIRKIIGDHLRTHGHRVREFPDGEAGLEHFKRHAADVVITDIKMPRYDGFEVLREVKQHHATADVIFITAFGDMPNALRAMREGAFDFFTKPIKLREITAALQRTVRFQALQKENARMQKQLDQFRQASGISALIGNSAQMQSVRELIQRVSQTDATTVLIQGETGTGKELVARAIHSESNRSHMPFVTVDCSSIAPSLIENDLFGHEKGAFTDASTSQQGQAERAQGGTLFLDEIGDMAPELQTRLLRMLETHHIRRLGGTDEIDIDIRIVAATNRNLPERIASGHFREDLFYRLNTFGITVPALRERPEDIVPLALHFITRYAREMRKPIQGLTERATHRLSAHPFPGNVRELRNLIERAVILCTEDQIDLTHLEFATLSPQQPAVSTRLPEHQAPSNTFNLPQTLNLEHLEKSAIEEALRRSNGNQVQAAKLLGITRYVLRRRIKRHHF